MVELETQQEFLVYITIFITIQVVSTWHVDHDEDCRTNRIMIQIESSERKVIKTSSLE